MRKKTAEAVLSTRTSLASSWDALATELVKLGASPEQLSAMKSTFYLGATKIYFAIREAGADYEQFFEVMEDLYEEIDVALTGLNKSGH